MKALCRRSTDCMLPINHGSRLEDLGFITEELCSTQTAGKKKLKDKKKNNTKQGLAPLFQTNHCPADFNSNSNKIHLPVII